MRQNYLKDTHFRHGRGRGSGAASPVVHARPRWARSPPLPSDLTARSRALTSSRSRVREYGRSAAGAGEALGVPAGPRAGVVEIGETAAAKPWRSKSHSLDELDRKFFYMCIVCFRG